MNKLRHRLPLVFLTLTILCGLLRWIVSIEAIPADTVQFSNLHDITWNANTNTMNRTGNDPYAFFVLPPAAVPIRKVSFVFLGEYVPTEGTFYIFQSPARLKPGQDVEVVKGKYKKTMDGFEISGKLQDSTTLRLDLPDFLTRPIEFRRAVITTPFINWSSWPFRLMLVCLVGFIATLRLALRRSSPARASA